MRRLALLLTGLLSVAAALPLGVSPQVVGLRVKVVSVDPVEREFRAEGQARRFIGVFSTHYRLRGLLVPPGVFWWHVTPGDVLSIKVRKHELFNVAVAADISLDN